MIQGLFLYRFWIFNLDFSTIASFLFGILMGIVLLLLFYVLLVVLSLHTKNYVLKPKKEDLNSETVKKMIADTQASYKDKTLRGDLGRVAYCQRLAKDLAYGIAVSFYPDSKHPFLELSINELTMLSTYITKRVDELLNHRGIRMLRKLKISTIVDFTTKKKQVEDSKIYQTTVAVGGKLSKVKYVLNAINPLNWGRKIILDQVMNLIINQICLVVLAIVGEETYKIYSKKVFHKEVSVDTGSEAFIEEMSQTIKPAAEEMEWTDETSDPVFHDRGLKRRLLKTSEGKNIFFPVDETVALKKKIEKEQVV